MPYNGYQNLFRGQCSIFYKCKFMCKTESDRQTDKLLFVVQD
jgi:hypothetical protein